MRDGKAGCTKGVLPRRIAMAGRGQELQGIALLEDNELLIGQLYRQFAARLPRQVRLWASLAADEMRHAWLLKSVRTRVSSALARRDDSARFDLDSLATFRDFMKGLLYGTLEKDVSAEGALRTALYIQWSLQEQEVFHHEDRDPGELRSVLETLAAGNYSHTERLLRALKRAESQRSLTRGAWTAGVGDRAAQIASLPVVEETFNHLGYFSA